VEIARLLNIKLTSRSYNKGRIPMCGFPLTHLDKNIKILVQQNKRFVAMCEEFPRFVPGAPKPEFDRRVVRVITPGTLIDEPFLNQYENNYLLSISFLDALSVHDSADIDTSKAIGLAWIDVSTGEFFVKSSMYDSLRDELARIGPKEIVLDKRLEPHPSHPIRAVLTEEGNFVSYITSSEGSTPDYSSRSKVVTANLIASAGGDESLTPSISTLTPHETSAISLLTTFLNANLLEHMPTLSFPNREDTGGRMQIDSHTIRALEIRGGATEGTTKGSLLSVIKRTVTSSGTRLLARWLCKCVDSLSKRCC
jgi:DNA mismatch repair ATPase MutS